MLSIKFTKIKICLLTFLLILFLGNIALSLHTKNISDRIEKHLASMPENTINSRSLKSRSGSASKNSEAPDDTESTNYFFNNDEQENKISRFRSIIENSGLEELTAMKNFDTEMFLEMMKYNIREEQLEYYRKQAQQQVILDRQRFGKEPEQLAQRISGVGLEAGFDPRTMTREEQENYLQMRLKESREAFDKLIKEYPDSYAAANALCRKVKEQASQFGLKNSYKLALKKAEEKGNYELAERYRQIIDTNKISGSDFKVDEYYRMLKNFEKRNSVILNSGGFKAVPEIELRLATAYTQAGMADKADKLLETLRTEYTNADLFGYGPEVSGPTILSVPEMLEKKQNALSVKRKNTGQ